MLKEILAIIGGIIAIPCLIVFGILIYAIGGAVVGAVCGEILDYIPYLKDAIPQGLGLLFNFFSLENTLPACNILKGNLDKLGAALGFIGGFFRTSMSNNSKKN